MILFYFKAIVKSHDFSALIFNDMDFLTSQIFIKSADMNRRIKDVKIKY